MTKDTKILIIKSIIRVVLFIIPEFLGIINVYNKNYISSCLLSFFIAIILFILIDIYADLYSYKLRRQINEMKNCQNCKHGDLDICDEWECTLGFHGLGKNNEQICENLSKWELAE